jgi:hypothetical protein
MHFLNFSQKKDCKCQLLNLLKEKYLTNVILDSNFFLGFASFSDPECRVVSLSAWWATECQGCSYDDLCHGCGEAPFLPLPP